MDIDIISGGIYGKRQTFSVRDGAAMHQHIMLLPLGLRFLAESGALHYLQVIKPADDRHGTQAQQSLPGAQAPERRFRMALNTP